MLAVPLLLGIAATAPSAVAPPPGGRRPGRLPRRRDRPGLAARPAPPVVRPVARRLRRRLRRRRARPARGLPGPRALRGRGRPRRRPRASAERAPERRRDLANSLAQTAIALVLVPAAAYVSGAWETEAVVRATLVAAGYLVGTVLVVRSVIRERGNRGFVALSVGFHAALPARRGGRAAVAVRRLRGRPPGAGDRPAARRAPARGDAAPAAPGPGRDRRDRGLDGPRRPRLRGPALDESLAPRRRLRRFGALHGGPGHERVGEVAAPAELDDRPAVAGQLAGHLEALPGPVPARGLGKRRQPLLELLEAQRLASQPRARPRGAGRRPPARPAPWRARSAPAPPGGRARRGRPARAGRGRPAPPAATSRIMARRRASRVARKPAARRPARRARW